MEVLSLLLKSFFDAVSFFQIFVNLTSSLRRNLSDLLGIFAGVFNLSQSTFLALKADSLGRGLIVLIRMKSQQAFLVGKEALLHL